MFENLSKREQLIFLAGIFEGEGWFGLNKKPNGWTPAAVLEVQMTDEDIVKRFQYYFKTNGNIHKKKKKQKDYHKQVWRFWLKGYRALHFMEEMLPYLGTRRQKQYYDVVKIIGDGPKNWSSPLSEQTENQTSDVGCTINACRKDRTR